MLPPSDSLPDGQPPPVAPISPPSTATTTTSRTSTRSSDIPGREVVEVAAGLVFRGGKLLITQRPAAGHLAGYWEFPGGKRESNESFEQCLHRELKEELGIEVDVHELIESITHSYPTKTVDLRFFHCSWKRHEPRTLGCPAFNWVTAAELAKYTFPEADARLLDRLRDTPQLWTVP